METNLHAIFFVWGEKIDGNPFNFVCNNLPSKRDGPGCPAPAQSDALTHLPIPNFHIFSPFYVTATALIANHFASVMKFCKQAQQSQLSLRSEGRGQQPFLLCWKNGLVCALIS